MSPGRAQEIEKIKTKSHDVGSEIYMGSNKCTILYIMVWVGIFELAVGMVRSNSGQSNLGQSEPS